MLMMALVWGIGLINVRRTVGVAECPGKVRLGEGDILGADESGDVQYAGGNLL
jgi:hypothetical protein